MSTMPTATEQQAIYEQNLFSPAGEQGNLIFEFARGASKLQSDKRPAERCPISWIDPAPSGSFNAFCTTLLQFNFEDEDDQISQEACNDALTIVLDAYLLLPSLWSTPWIATDGGGGVRLTWRLDGREIRAVFPSGSQRPRYLYAEEGNWHQMIRNFTATTLYNQFQWLSESR